MGRYSKPRSAADDIPTVESNPGGDSMTDQHQMEDADINVIMARQMGPQVRKEPIWGDFTDALSFQEANNMIIDARRAFEDLPSKVRAEFENDPYQLLRFLENPKNRKRAEELGLVDPEPPPEPEKIQKVQVVKSDEEANPTFKKPAEAGG